MSGKLENLVAFYVTSKYKNGPDDGARYKVEKQLEHDVIEEIVHERIDQIDSEVKRREKERKTAREFDEFQSVLLQCVTLALLVGVLGSHLYGLLEALLYQPDQNVNVLWMMIGLGVLVAITGVVLFGFYLRKLFDSTKKFREFHRKLNDER